MGPEHPPSSELERAAGGGSWAVTTRERGQLKSSQGQPGEGNFQNMWRRVMMKHHPGHDAKQMERLGVSSNS